MHTSLGKKIHLNMHTGKLTHPFFLNSHSHLTPVRFLLTRQKLTVLRTEPSINCSKFIDELQEITKNNVRVGIWNSYVKCLLFPENTALAICEGCTYISVGEKSFNHRMVVSWNPFCFQNQIEADICAVTVSKKKKNHLVLEKKKSS